ncbi:AbrB/MazE/SpoVT family DNA-binding domain-containing protein [Paenibacillus apiarius]|uniref:AbrB/MazE/SpoVT family DNA-binding domain-containing protein n=1 Tax=Paenibacillus apiarius TaxID=46240 RepID=A0ABT4DUV6_9BACL|nr:AbrB/MazE/SpoVT family DNA-binding domain-containing protein [Paenibacillus apiarius]MCY9516404.1 AbrB/MazE/SpoVT family DNA-binding domain-containing protein [Paenibacillus apiarius]MCY9521136.1 AbrB/MazE/SpoVT family DNA-binding domain-containing protein [Paenibacillus apiarius]MCY9551983.1 AbrB/MazE/SpoVT family DNA-binding domain-containing protein [Paenibacillus apiarius]MCY9560928.1 AbrB/MazE/SpoVT family DNA-binding domain-containing protein [Paenibacillus apiarius]MCY9684557.1 AbrB/
MKRKLMRIGNSYGVIFTKDMLDKLDAEFGDTLDVEISERTGEVIIRKSSPNAGQQQLHELYKASI